MTLISTFIYAMHVWEAFANVHFGSIYQRSDNKHKTSCSSFAWKHWIWDRKYSFSLLVALWGTFCPETIRHQTTNACAEGLFDINKFIQSWKAYTTYDPVWEQEGCARILNLISLAWEPQSREAQHYLTSRCGRWAIRIWMLPLFQQVLGFLHQYLGRISLILPQSMVERRATYSLLPWFCDVLVGFEEGSDVHSLSSPEVPMNSPVEGELEGTPIEAAVIRRVSARCLSVRVRTTRTG